MPGGGYAGLGDALFSGYVPNDAISDFYDTHISDLKRFGFRQVLLPVLFDGGNVITDRVKEKSYLFLGTNEIISNIRFYREILGIRLSALEIIELFGNCFAVHEVVAMGLALEDIERIAEDGEQTAFMAEGIIQQSLYLYHLDMLMVVHPNQRASVVDIPALTAAEEHLVLSNIERRVQAEEGLAGTALTQEVDKTFSRFSFQLNYAIEEAKRDR